MQTIKTFLKYFLAILIGITLILVTVIGIEVLASYYGFSSFLTDLSAWALGFGAGIYGGTRVKQWFERHFPTVTRNVSSQLQRLAEPTPERTLTPNEIQQFKQCILNEKDIAKKREHQDQLNKYENFIAERCPISFTAMNELNWPVTIEHKNEPSHHAKTYE